jgi:hypothetical protein
MRKLNRIRLNPFKFLSFLFQPVNCIYSKFLHAHFFTHQFPSDKGRWYMKICRYISSFTPPIREYETEHNKLRGETSYENRSALGTTPRPQAKPINSGCFVNQNCQVNGAVAHILPLVASIIRAFLLHSPLSVQTALRTEESTTKKDSKNIFLKSRGKRGEFNIIVHSIAPTIYE